MTARQDRFFSYVRDKLERIDDITSDKLAVHKRVLYVTYIDSLSALVYPAYTQNRARFTDFVVKFGGWQHAERVSTPHLVRALSLNPDPAYDKVRALAMKTLGEWRSGSHIDLSFDLAAGFVGSHWPNGKLYEQPIVGATWTHLKHVELLYAYRNSLVHDFRALGPGYDFPEDEDPYYISTHTSSVDSNVVEFHWELVYPSAFLCTLATSALDSLEAHIRGNQIDPFEVLSTGRFWIEALNR
jgi:hypothetical protein